jgi:hypothetical protein
MVQSCPTVNNEPIVRVGPVAGGAKSMALMALSLATHTCG